jgi:hypothetical protein
MVAASEWKKEMSIKIMTDVWANGPGTHGELLVLLALADHADDEGVCWPSHKKIALKSRMSDRNVRRVLVKLEEAGYLKILSSGGGRGRPNKYQVIPNPDNLSTTAKPGHDGSLNPDTAMSDEPSLESSSKNPPIVPPPGDVCVTSDKTPFEEFWKIVWAKTNKAGAERAWKKLSEENRRKAIGLAAQFFRKWRADYPHASPIHPSTYLNNRRWEDLGAGVVMNGGGAIIITIDDQQDLKAVKERTGLSTLRDPNVIWFSKVHGDSWIKWSPEAEQYEYLDPPKGYTEDGHQNAPATGDGGAR